MYIYMYVCIGEENRGGYQSLSWGVGEPRFCVAGAWGLAPLCPRCSFPLRHIKTIHYAKPVNGFVSQARWRLHKSVPSCNLRLSEALEPGLRRSRYDPWPQITTDTSRWKDSNETHTYQNKLGGYQINTKIR